MNMIYKCLIVFVLMPLVLIFAYTWKTNESRAIQTPPWAQQEIVDEQPVPSVGIPIPRAPVVTERQNTISRERKVIVQTPPPQERVPLFKRMFPTKKNNCDGKNGCCPE